MHRPSAVLALLLCACLFALAARPASGFDLPSLSTFAQQYSTLARAVRDWVCPRCAVGVCPQLRSGGFEATGCVLHCEHVELVGPLTEVLAAGVEEQPQRYTCWRKCGLGGAAAPRALLPASMSCREDCRRWAKGGSSTTSERECILSCDTQIDL